MDKKLPLSVSIITFNEEENLPNALKSIKDIAEEIIIVDSGSTDKTVSIAKDYGAKVFIEKWKGYVAQKNSALEKCTKDWILSLDADEIVSEELKDNIIRVINSPDADGYYINRITYYSGKFLKHSWQPDWKLRLVKRKANPKWKGIDPHDFLTIDGKTSKLSGYLLHYSYKDIYDHFFRALKYSKISAENYYKLGKKFRIYNLIFNPIWAFVKQYILKLGFLDGLRGLSVAKSYSFSIFLKYMFLWELEQKGKDKNGKS